jgi:hypothetical protein
MIATSLFLSRQGTLPEVPWVMGDPTSTYKWQVSAAGKGKKGKGKKKTKSETLENITLNIYLDVKRKEVDAGFLGGLRGAQVKEAFNIISAAKAILRGLHKAKYREVEAVTGDGKTLYYAKVDDKPFKEIVDGLKDSKGSPYKVIKIKAAHGNHRKAYAEIQKYHARKKAPIKVAIEGKISTATLNTFVGYLNKHLPVKEVSF